MYVRKMLWLVENIKTRFTSFNEYVYKSVNNMIFTSNYFQDTRTKKLKSTNLI